MVKMKPGIPIILTARLFSDKRFELSDLNHLGDVIGIIWFDEVLFDFHC